MWNKLFSSSYQYKIKKVLPTLFNMVELENKRGKKLGMEVGNARERVIIALFMYVYGKDEVEFPASTSPELDAVVCQKNVSIKTKSRTGYGGVKLSWTVDRERILQFVKSFTPQSDMLYINIIWGGEGGFFLIPKESQLEIRENLGCEFFKIPATNTNPRGVELSGKAMRQMQEHSDTLSFLIKWERDKTLLTERALYGRWIDLWDSL